MPVPLSRCIRCCAIVTLLLVSCPDSLPAAGGALAGFLTGPDGSALPATRVEVRSARAGVQVTVFTDGDGRFTIEDLPPGIDYEVLAGNGLGVFSPAVQDRVVLREGQVTHEPLQLNYTVHYWVLVHATHDGPIVDLTEVGQRSVYDSAFIAGLPRLCGY